MALATIAAAVLPSVISAFATAGASKLASNIFGGGGGSSVDFTPPGINAGGLTSTFKNGGFGIKSSPLRDSLVGKVAATFPQQAGILSGLRQSVAPGMSALRASRLSNLENSRRQAIGDLRDNLQRRRVLGSSFASDALTRANLTFQQESDRIAAESFLQELELTAGLTQQEFDARRGEFQTTLDEMNLQADLAAKLAGAATTQLGENARLKADLDAQAAAGAGKFFGQTFGPVGDAVGNAVSGLFQPAAAAAPKFTALGTF